MPALSSVFLVLSLILAVVIGPQLRSWTWGPAMLAMVVALAAAVPAIWQRRKTSWDLGLLGYAVIVAGWFAWRAWTSPVIEFGQADLILLVGGVSAFVVVRAIEGNSVAEKILTWGIALLLLANVLAVFRQVTDPAFSPVFRSRSTEFPSGFYAHYNEAANYLIASSMWVAAAAVFGRHARLSRIFLALVAMGGLAAIYYTRSRGGIFGAAAGTGVFAMTALIAGKRTGAKWFAPALIALPLIGIGIGAFVYSGWAGRQSIQNAGGDLGGVFDNLSRLYFLGIAVSCIALHPLTGGGSRSFSWESFRFFEGKQQGNAITHLPEQVHNELAQAATDYGLIGAGLLVGLLGAWVILAVVRLLFTEGKTENPSADAWRIGGLSAVAGMFIQSSFSFVFHLFPGILLLGICLGFIARSRDEDGGKGRGFAPKLLLTVTAAACLLVLLPFGWKGTQVMTVLWPTYFSKHPLTGVSTKADALENALRIWPQASLHKDRAMIFQEIAAKGGAASASAADQAIADYTAAQRLHPYNPDFPVNLGNLQSLLKHDAEAETAYARAVELQGGMEPAFRAHFLFSSHLLEKSSRLFDPASPQQTLPVMEKAADEMEQAFQQMPYGINEFSTRVAIHDALGFARESCGDNAAALKAYDFTAGLVGGSRGHYRAGELYGKMGDKAWRQRNPALAMACFNEAHRRILFAGELPDGVTAEKRTAVIQYLERAIGVFQQNKIEPAPLPTLK